MLPSFWKQYENLPHDIKRLSKRKFALFLDSPTLVDFKRLNTDSIPPFYSVRIDENYRAIGYLKADTIGCGLATMTTTCASLKAYHNAVLHPNC